MARLTSRRLLLLLVAFGLVGVLLLVLSSTGSAPDLPTIFPPRAPGVPEDGSWHGFVKSGLEVRWTDNSSDEEGFRIRIGFTRVGETYTFTVPANSTSFIIPNSVPGPSTTWDECAARAVFWVTITAFNAAGESDESGFMVTGDCGTPIPKTPTPAAR